MNGSVINLLYGAASDYFPYWLALECVYRICQYTVLTKTSYVDVINILMSKILSRPPPLLFREYKGNTA